ISREYIQYIERNEIGLIKREFDMNKKFTESQKLLGSERTTSDNDDNYEHQLKKFPTLLKIINKILEFIEDEKDVFTKNLGYNKIDTSGLSFSDKHDKEFRASIIELVLEGLRYADNPILERSENGDYEIHR
ncbi:MAG TPA: hypothetical protein VFK40_13475, partial [Nitrososphaeraceae archaeon]|nr:hypothetical protein [Nitrososphaeraceae archaeon]